MSWEGYNYEDVRRAAEETTSHLTPVSLHFLENCVSCALCEVNCPYTPVGEEYGPVSKAEPLRNIYRGKVNILPRLFPWLFGAKLPKTKEELDKWVDLAYHCTNCGLCYITCPFGIHSGEMIKTLRGFLAKTGRIPSLLKLMVDAETSGMFAENPGFRGLWEDVIRKTLEVANVEFDRKGAKYLYMPSLAEAMITPGAIPATARILSKLGLNWTMPRNPLSIRAPIGSLAGDDESVRVVAKRIYDYIKSIGAEYVVLSDGGYPYTFFRFDLPRIVGEEPSFKVVHVVELLVDALREGKVKFKQTQERITWHSPCKMGRFGGLIEEPVEVLSSISQNFVKLKSHGLFSKCCGGGGSIACIVPPTQEFMEKVMGIPLKVSENEKAFLDKLYRDMLIAGREKVQEIKESGASTVVTACIGCIHTLGFTTRAYDVKVTLKTLAEVVAEALD